MSKRQEHLQNRVYVRKFLNLQQYGTIALLLCDTSAYGTEITGKGEPRPPRFDGNITIGDCSRTITLDLNIGNWDVDGLMDGKMSKEQREDYENVRHKLDLLIETLSRVSVQLDTWRKRNYPKEPR